jgi:hypothetical protein
MKRLIGRGFVVLALVLLATTMATQAQAGICAFPSLCIEYSLNNGITVTPLVSGASGSIIVDPAATLGSFQVDVSSAESNSPGNASLAELLSSTLSITNTGSSTQTLELFIGDVNFSAPTAPPGIEVNSHIGGTVAVGSSANLLSFKSCVDPNNGQNVCGISTPSGLVTAGPGTPNVTGSPSSSFKDDKYATILSLGAPYSISQFLKITLGAGSQLNFSDSTTLTPVPEPVSIGLLGGILLLTNRMIRRKSKQNS